MGYIAVKGGKDAILNAEKLVDYYRCRNGGRPIKVKQIMDQMRLAVDRVMSEGSLYAPEVAAIALKQAEGDVFEASYLLRAYRSTLSRIGYSVAAKTEEMFLIRRISSAFQDIPWGQVLGPTRDYTQRLIRFELLEEDEFQLDPPYKEDNSPLNEPVEKVIEYLRREGLLKDRKVFEQKPPYDITRQPLVFPLDRTARLQRLTRGEEGGLLMLAYASLRGWGSVHPTLAEVRVGYLPVKIKHPNWGTEVVIGKIMVTEVEAICKFDKSSNNKNREEKTSYSFSLGYGLIFGHNDRKAISMAILDRALCTEEATSPVEEQEFVLYHIDGMESQGFTAHLKLPHYVTFQSSLDRLRKIQGESAKSEEIPLKK
jgi:alpha-D-ribose 1-methylphosphonate 5-triphosphate synthase subunit PhnI